MNNKCFITFNIFDHLGAREDGRFNNQTETIMVHIYPLIYIRHSVQELSRSQRNVCGGVTTIKP